MCSDVRLRDSTEERTSKIIILSVEGGVTDVALGAESTVVRASGRHIQPHSKGESDQRWALLHLSSSSFYSSGNRYSDSGSLQVASLDSGPA
jgi:hypothetical protein